MHKSQEKVSTIFVTNFFRLIQNIILIFIIVSNGAYANLYDMLRRKTYHFDSSDTDNLMKVAIKAQKDGKESITFADLSGFGYDREFGNQLMSFADCMPQFVEKLEFNNGMYKAIIKKPQ